MPSRSDARRLGLAASIALAGCGADADPPVAAPSCPAGQVWSETSCVAIACGAGHWGDALAEDDILVDATAEDGGNGSEAAPYRTIQEAADEAADRGGGAVRVAIGEYPEALEFRDDHVGVSVRGRCAELVRLLPADRGDDGQGVFLRAEGTVTLGGLTVEGATGTGVVVREGTLVLKDVVLRGNTGAGVLLQGSDAEVDMTGGAIEGTLPTLAYEGAVDGYGVYVGRGATATLRGTRVTGNVSGGLLVDDADSLATLWNVDVSGSVAQDRASAGHGIIVYSGATLRMTGGSVTGNEDAGVDASSWNQWPGTATVVLSGVDITDNGAAGISASNDAVVAVTGGTLARNVGAGLFFFASSDYEGPNAVNGVLAGVTVSDNVPEWSGAGGYGAEVSEGSHLAVSGATFSRNRTGALHVLGAGTTVVLQEQTRIEDTLPNEDGAYGAGVGVYDGAYLGVHDTTFDANRHIGVYVDGEGTTAELTGVTIQGTRADDAGNPGGAALVAAYGATVTAETCTFSDNEHMGVQILDAETTARLTDVTIGGVGVGDGPFGYGLALVDGPTVFLDGVTISETWCGGLVLVRSGSPPEEPWSNLTITDVYACPTYQTALGLYQEGGTVAATGLDVERVAGPGLYAHQGASVACDGCTFADNRYAGVAATDAQIALDSVVLRDNVAHTSEGGGVGVYVRSDASPASLRLIGASAITGSPLAAVYVAGAGTFSVEGVDATAGESERTTVWPHENGIFAWCDDGAADATDLAVAASALSGFAGGAIFLDGCSASVDGVSVTDTALSITQQRCAGVPAPTGVGGLDGVDLCPPYDHHVEPLTYSIFLEVPEIPE